jgi:non-specific serine/threonine protein kinase
VVLSERLAQHKVPAVEIATSLAGVLHGLAFAHEGGAAHRDIQPYLIVVGEAGAAQLLGLEVAGPRAGAAGRDADSVALTSADALALPALREAARADVLGVGLLLHQMLAGTPALDEADLGKAAQRLPPSGRDLVRLPWSTPLPVPEALRAIANRSTERQPRQRYGSARSLLRALEGWLRSISESAGGPLALLIDRLHSVGSLPAMPGSAERAARLALMERHRTDELAEVVLQDLALSFEMLRWVNSAQVRSTQAAGGAPVLTVRRAIAMLGLDGVRRAALGLRPWPGPLDEGAADELRRLVESVKRAGRIAQALRPPGYDAEVVYLLTLLQNLGRLIAAYHFPDELQQIRRLMQPVHSQRDDEPDEPGMSEQAASFAVLGADVEVIGAAVARHWGLDESLLHLMRRLPSATPPRKPDNDDDVLRAVASAGNESAEAQALHGAPQGAALARVVQRYARILDVELRDLQRILQLPATGRARAAAVDASVAHGG